ncbi:MAG: SMC-Scp complex subunit ScpB [Chloroflexi bacterium]|nr:SMC-Scp complex subunit ScpB [Chloroflexota bacterium]
MPAGTTDASPEIATEIRRRRELLGWSQVRLARESGVGRTAVSEIEAGRRLPSVRTYARLRGALGLAAPAAALIRPDPPRTPTEELLRRACACLVAAHHLPLADLASALDVGIPAARELVLAGAARLAAVGYALTEDGSEVRLWPLAEVGEAVSRVAAVEVEHEVSAEQLEVLAIVVTLGAATRAEVERYRGEGSESLLARLIRRGLLARVRDEREPGAPNVYRATAKALRAAGFPTVEALRAAITLISCVSGVRRVHEPATRRLWLKRLSGGLVLARRSLRAACRLFHQSLELLGIPEDLGRPAIGVARLHHPPAFVLLGCHLRPRQPRLDRPGQSLRLLPAHPRRPLLGRLGRLVHALQEELHLRQDGDRLLQLGGVHPPGVALLLPRQPGPLERPVQQHQGVPHPWQLARLPVPADDGVLEGDHPAEGLVEHEDVVVVGGMGVHGAQDLQLPPEVLQGERGSGAIGGHILRHHLTPGARAGRGSAGDRSPGARGASPRSPRPGRHPGAPGPPPAGTRRRGGGRGPAGSRAGPPPGPGAR